MTQGPPGPLKDVVYRALEEMIIYGKLQPGDHLVETDLARRLRVSRAPVREALHLLHRDGWVDLRPRQGAFVHRPTFREVDEIFHMRTVLEVESARLATLNCTEDGLQALKEVLEAGDEASRGGDERALVVANSNFHETVTHLADNSVLEQMISRLDKRIRWYFAPVVRRRSIESWREHAEIVEAIASGDPERTAGLMRRHAELTKAAYHQAREGSGVE